MDEIWLKMYSGLHVKFVILVRYYWSLNILHRYSKNTPIPNFTKIRSMRAKLFREGARTDMMQLFHQPTLRHSFLYSLTIRLLHYYPRHVSSINMPIFRRKNCIHTASGMSVRSQPVYCADVYRERRYQMLCEYNFSSWRWAC